MSTLALALIPMYTQIGQISTQEIGLFALIIIVIGWAILHLTGGEDE